MDYTRYLAAKTTVDDRALNRQVLAEVRRLMPSYAPRILEVGAGLGTMAARLTEWQVLKAGEYVVLDVDQRLLDDSRHWLAQWAAAAGVRFEPLPDGCLVGALRVRLVHAELGQYLAATGGGAVDLLVAHAFLDLVDLPTVLPALLGLLAPGGVYWFTINYDGESVFLPEHPYDDAVLRAYHQDMDERVRFGRPAGDSRTGRHLLGRLYAVGAPPLAVGSSDWVVHPGPPGTYAHDEAYFLASILQTLQDALAAHPDRVRSDDLGCWLADRRRQLAAGELVYIAHQLDVAGQAPTTTRDGPSS